MERNLLVRGGTCVTAEATLAADVLVRGGRVAALLAPGVAVDPEIPVLDARGCHVLPGCLDVHVHFREPGLEHKEDFLTGSAGAALGGVTCVFDMPNTKPPVASAAVVQEKWQRLAGRSWVDYGFYGVVLPDNLAEMAGMAAAGVIGFKIFAGPTTGNLPAPNWGQMIEVYRTAARLDRPIALHAEDREVVEHWTAQVRAQGGNTYDDLLASRPDFSEAACIAMATLLAEQTGCRLHIVHVNTAEGAAIVAVAKARGVPVTAETCPPYLFLTREDYSRLGNAMKILPLVRDGSDQAALWRALVSGEIDCVSTDHAPHLPAEKAGDIWSAAAGATGVETMLPLLLTALHAGRFGLQDLVRMTSLRPAQIYGVYPRKGSLAVGADGDLTVVDLERTGRVEAARLQTKAKQSPFDGWPLRGLPVATVVRGAVVMREGGLLGPPPGAPVQPGTASDSRKE